MQGASLRLARVGLITIVLGLATGGCAASPTARPGTLTVVTTSAVFGDLVANVGGDLVTVRSLVPKNGDVHTFEPRPSDMRTLAAADLVIINGLGLDDWMTDVIDSAAPAGTPLIRLGEDLPGVPLLPGDDPDTQNPHLWMDVANAKLYADRIARALADVDPAHAEAFAGRNSDYQTRLNALDAWVREQIETVPADNRRIVTYHDAFPYYARAYGLEIVAVAVPAPGQEPSAAYTAQLIQTIRDTGARAILAEAQFPTDLVSQLAAETGVKVLADLYSDSLGDPPITSYEAVIRWDTEHVVDALK